MWMPQRLVRRLWLVGGLLVATACGSDGGGDDAGADSGTATSDAGAPDSGDFDAGAPDSGAPDSGEPDSGEPPIEGIAVTTTEDELNEDGDCSLREAIRAANLDEPVDACEAGTGDEDTIVLPAGTYTLTIEGADEDDAATGDLDLTGALVILGDGADVTTIDGGEIDRVVHVLAGANVRIEGVTIRDGAVRDAHGGAVLNEGTLVLDRVQVSDSRAEHGWGGGIANRGTLTVRRSAVVGNVSLGAPGTDGVNGGGGGGGAAGLGGGLFNFESAELVVENSTISSNVARGGAGGRGPNNNGWFEAEGAPGGGAEGGAGGAVAGPGGMGGFASGGGGGGSDGSFPGAGGAGGFGGGGGGGGARTFGGDPGPNGAGGFAGGNGGGGCCSGASAGGGGGGIGAGLFDRGGTVRLENVTIAGNNAVGGAGGGTAFAGPAQAGRGVGAGLFTYGGTVTVRNSIIAGNSGDEQVDCGTYEDGAITSAGYNVVGLNTGCPTPEATDQAVDDAGLADLAVDGGSTPTHALLESSPARGAGSCTDSAGATVAEDQRGVSRPQPVGTECDVGAYEAN